MREDEYQTQGIHWPMEYGLLGKREVRAAWEAVANAEKRGYYYPETDNGEKFVSSGRYLMVIDTDYRNPTIQTIFEFDDAVADPMDYAKELIINAAGDEDRLRDAYRAIENLFGEGHVVQHDRRSYKSASREIGSRKGSAGGRNSGNARTGKRARCSYALKEDTEVNGFTEGYHEHDEADRAALKLNRGPYHWGPAIPGSGYCKCKSPTVLNSGAYAKSDHSSSNCSGLRLR